MKFILLVVLSLIVLISGGWAYRYFTAPVEGRVGAQEQIQSAPMRITAYNHFFDLLASIQAYDPAIKAQEEALTRSALEADKERILANIAGLKAQKARLIFQYNADARKDYTIGQFRDVSLPYQIENK